MLISYVTQLMMQLYDNQWIHQIHAFLNPYVNQLVMHDIYDNQRLRPAWAKWPPKARFRMARSVSVHMMRSRQKAPTRHWVPCMWRVLRGAPLERGGNHIPPKRATSMRQFLTLCRLYTVRDFLTLDILYRGEKHLNIQSIQRQRVI